MPDWQVWAQNRKFNWKRCASKLLDPDGPLCLQSREEVRKRIPAILLGFWPQIRKYKFLLQGTWLVNVSTLLNWRRPSLEEVLGWIKPIKNWSSNNKNWKPPLCKYAWGETSRSQIFKNVTAWKLYGWILKFWICNKTNNIPSRVSKQTSSTGEQTKPRKANRFTWQSNIRLPIAFNRHEKSDGGHPINKRWSKFRIKKRREGTSDA